MLPSKPSNKRAQTCPFRQHGHTLKPRERHSSTSTRAISSVGPSLPPLALHPGCTHAEHLYSTLACACTTRARASWGAPSHHLCTPSPFLPPKPEAFRVQTQTRAQACGSNSTLESPRRETNNRGAQTVRARPHELAIPGTARSRRDIVKDHIRSYLRVLDWSI